MLVPVLTVAENILLGDEPMANPIFLDRRDAHDRIRKLGRQFGFEIDPDAKVGSLSVGWQQRVEILKALYRSASGPRPRRADGRAHAAGDRARSSRSSASSHAELATSIIFISHKLYEVLDIADRITVIRRGKVVGSRVPTETNEEDLAELMVGRDVQLTVDRGESTPGGVALRRRRAPRRRRPRTRGRPWRQLRGPGGRDLRHRRRRRQRPGRAGRGDHAGLRRTLLRARSPSTVGTSPGHRRVTSTSAASGSCPPTGTGSGWSCPSRSPTTWC